jgi:hypothetical protein
VVDDKNSKYELNAKPAGNKPPINPALIVGKKKCDSDEDNNAKHAAKD